MFGNLAEMANLIKKAKEIKSNMQTMKNELAAMEVSGAAGGSKVIAVVSGDFLVKRITIDPSLAGDAETMEALTMAAVNDAINNAKKAAQEKMTELTGGLDIPGLF